MNHFLLTGNELVADWPTPSAEYFVWSSQNVESWNEKVIAYENRPRYTCTPELLAMLKEGERYQEGVHFEKEFKPGYLGPRGTRYDNDWVAIPVKGNVNKGLWNTCIHEAIVKAKLGSIVYGLPEVQKVIEKLEKLKI